MIEIDELSHGYLDVVQYVLKHGASRAPRGLRTLEVTSEVIRLANPRTSLPLGVGRALNPAIAAIEALQLIGGFSDPDLVCKISPPMAQFKDDGIFYGSYGNRIGWQMPTIVRRLVEDRDTRRAVLGIWDASKDTVEGMHDYPCTNRLTFSIIDDQLVLETSMRSNDVWLGFAYDVFQFTQLQLVVAACLDLEPGPYYHHATSLHIYERDLEAVEQLHPPTEPGMRFEAVTGATGDVRSYQERARQLVYDDPNPRNETEKWLLTKLAKYL